MKWAKLAKWDKKNKDICTPLSYDLAYPQFAQSNLHWYFFLSHHMRCSSSSSSTSSTLLGCWILETVASQEINHLTIHIGIKPYNFTKLSIYSEFNLLNALYCYGGNILTIWKGMKENQEHTNGDYSQNLIIGMVLT